MGKIIYSKMTRERLEKFQIETSVYVEKGEKKVAKKAMSASAIAHIREMQQNYVRYENWNIHMLVNSQLNEKKDTIVFEYVEGLNLAEKLLKEVVAGEKDKAIELLRQHKDLIDMMAAGREKDFETSEQFEFIFGKHEGLEGKKAATYLNIDMAYDNVLEREEQYLVIDPEWIFEMLVPVNFVYYRAIYLLFDKFGKTVESLISLEEFYQIYGITAEEAEIYRMMDIEFMKYVFGSKGDYADLIVEYRKKVHDVKVDSTQHVAQIYFDEGEGYTEENSRTIYLEKDKDKYEVEITLEEGKNINSIRFDPVECAGIIKINEIYFIDYNGTISWPEWKTVNSACNDGNVAYFDMDDPQYQIILERDDIKSFTFKYEVEFADMRNVKKVADILSNEKKFIIEEKDKIFAEKEEILAEIERKKYLKRALKALGIIKEGK